VDDDLATYRTVATSSPWANRAAVAAANVQPVPWVVAGLDPGLAQQLRRARTTSTAASPGMCPPLTTTHQVPVRPSSSDAAIASSTVDAP
jgi:hypothetical protein